MPRFHVHRVLCDRRGASPAEYIVIIALVALGGMAAWKAFGANLFGASGKQGTCVAEIGADGSSAGCGGPGGGSQGPIASLDPGSGGTGSGGTPNRCFVAGTPVDTPDGLRPIEQVRAGDTVLSRDPESGELVPGRVVRTFVTPAQPVVDVRIAEAPGGDVQATPGHAFWTMHRGWVPAAALDRGEEVLTADGAPAHVEGVAAEPSRRTVYNFEVAGTHTYFVGAARIWVHNAGCDGNGPPSPVDPASVPLPPSPVDPPPSPLTSPATAPPQSPGPSGPQPVWVPDNGSYTPPPGPTNSNVLSGHGVYTPDPSEGTFKVPPGTSVSFPSWHNTKISNEYGAFLESGGSAGALDDGKASGAHTYGPGDIVPNYTLKPPLGLKIYPHPMNGYPTTVTQPTKLSNLLKPNMGNVQWAACMEDDFLCLMQPSGDLASGPNVKPGPYYTVGAYPPKNSTPLNYPTPPNAPPLNSGLMPIVYGKPPTTNQTPSPPATNGAEPPPRPAKPWWRPW